MNIRRFCELQNLPIKKVATDMGLTYDTFYKIYSGVNNPTLAMACRINKYSKGEIKFEDMLSNEVYEEIYESKR